MSAAPDLPLTAAWVVDTDLLIGALVQEFRRVPLRIVVKAARLANAPLTERSPVDIFMLAKMHIANLWDGPLLQAKLDPKFNKLRSNICRLRRQPPTPATDAALMGMVMAPLEKTAKAAAPASCMAESGKTADH